MINLGKMPKSHKHIFSNAGKKEKLIYKYVYDEKHGCPRRVKNGVVNIDDFIQQSADTVDFKAIGQMLVDTRDNVVSHFSSVEGETIDLTGQPRNIHEFEALHNKIKSSYENYPDELKALFGSYEGFVTAYKSGTVGKIIENHYNVQAQKNPEVKPNEGGQE